MKSVQDHLAKANAHMTEARAMAMEARLKQEIAVRQEMLRRLAHLRALHKKGAQS